MAVACLRFDGVKELTGVCPSLGTFCGADRANYFLNVNYGHNILIRTARPYQGSDVVSETLESQNLVMNIYGRESDGSLGHTDRSERLGFTHNFARSRSTVLRRNQP